jgi:hypothetical protein
MLSHMNEEPRVVRLPSALTRRADSVVDSPSSPYGTFSDLVAVALRNQMEMEQVSQAATAARPLVVERLQAGMPSPPETTPLRVSSTDFALMTMPTTPPTYEVADGRPSADRKSLTFLTNRLNPIPVVLRLLANIGPISVADVRGPLTEVARPIGFHLRADDAAEGRSLAERRQTSWPVGDDVDKSITKFMASYLLDEQGRGALADLGLAELINGAIVPTELGLTLAGAPIPLLGEGDGRGTVSTEGNEILRTCLLANTAECAVLSTFLHAIQEEDGHQGAVDQTLMDAYGWNPAVTASHRAALVGRLRDLVIVAVLGRGPEARLRIPTSELAFIQLVDKSRLEADRKAER